MRRLLLLGLVLALVGCGAGSASVQGPKRSCTNPRVAKAMKRINADLHAMRAAAKLPVKDSLHGGTAINAATDRFLNDVLLAPIDPLVRNRLIDHAAASLHGVCEQCFQALEAERPIPAIAHAHKGTACHTK